MAKQKNKYVRKFARNAKKIHEQVRGGAVNSFGAKNRRRTVRKSKAKKKMALLTPNDCIKKADPTVLAPFAPEHQFDDFALDAQLLRNIAQCGYRQPTAVQDRAIAPILEGRDLIGIAQTGTGKTAAFLIPLLQLCGADHRKHVLILAPTRELALQIAREYERLAQGLNIEVATVVGGANMRLQKAQLAEKPRMMIATPGRLHDLVEQGAADLVRVNTIVIDEVDRMLDMGFLREIKYLLQNVRAQRQTLLFSATLKKDMRAIARTFLVNPVTVAITPRLSCANVEQSVQFIDYGDDKVEILHDLLIAPAVRKAIIFVKTKYAVQMLGAELAERGFRVAAMHGDLSQGARKRVLAQFANNTTPILIATDIVARGIDVPDVTHVINFDVPDNYEDYVHRIGRTGRCDKMGYAITFWDKA